MLSVVKASPLKLYSYMPVPPLAVALIWFKSPSLPLPLTLPQPLPLTTPQPLPQCLSLPPFLPLPLPLPLAFSLPLSVSTSLSSISNSIQNDTDDKDQIKSIISENSSSVLNPKNALLPGQLEKKSTKIKLPRKINNEMKIFTAEKFLSHLQNINKNSEKKALKGSALNVLISSWNNNNDSSNDDNNHNHSNDNDNNNNKSCNGKNDNNNNKNNNNNNDDDNNNNNNNNINDTDHNNIININNDDSNNDNNSNNNDCNNKKNDSNSSSSSSSTTNPTTTNSNKHFRDSNDDRHDDNNNNNNNNDDDNDIYGTQNQVFQTITDLNGSNNESDSYNKDKDKEIEKLKEIEISKIEKFRLSMPNLIANNLLKIQPRCKISQEVIMKKYRDHVQHLEICLFEESSSFEEYSDIQTLGIRLLDLLKKVHLYNNVLKKNNEC